MSMPGRIVTASPEHEVAYQDICALVNKHAGNLTAAELLAVASNMVGKLVALQDQRVTTARMAMEIVAHNLERGNATVLATLLATKGNG